MVAAFKTVLLRFIVTPGRKGNDFSYTTMNSWPTTMLTLYSTYCTNNMILSCLTNVYSFLILSVPQIKSPKDIFCIFSILTLSFRWKATTTYNNAFLLGLEWQKKISQIRLLLIVVSSVTMSTLVATLTRSQVMDFLTLKFQSMRSGLSQTCPDGLI